jgi:hypothetical protein
MSEQSKADAASMLPWTPEQAFLTAYASVHPDHVMPWEHLNDKLKAAIEAGLNAAIETAAIVRDADAASIRQLAGERGTVITEMLAHYGDPDRHDGQCASVADPVTLAKWRTRARTETA